MGELDMTSRSLIEDHLDELLPVLLPKYHFAALRTERTQIKPITEKISDEVFVAEIDGVEHVLHIELQAAHETGLPERMAAYHALLMSKLGRPVFSMVIYLCPEKPVRELSQRVQTRQLSFRYELFEPWETSIDITAVRNSPALAPLACLTRGISAADLPAIREAILAAPWPTVRRHDCLFFTQTIGERRFDVELLRSLLRSDQMQDSTIYQEVIEKGRVRGREEGLEEGKRALVRVVARAITKRLATPPADLSESLMGLEMEAVEALFDDVEASADEAAVMAALKRHLSDA